MQVAWPGWTSIRRTAAVRRNAGAGDHAGLVRSEEKRDARDIFRRADPERIFLHAPGGVLEVRDRALPLGRAVAAGDAFGQYAPGADRVHPHVVIGESPGEGARERQDPALGGGVDVGR